LKTHGRLQELEHTKDHKDMKTHGGSQILEDTRSSTGTWRHTEDHKDMNHTD
jgi:hypothetical protein